MNSPGTLSWWLGREGAPAPGTVDIGRVPTIGVFLFWPESLSNSSLTGAAGLDNVSLMGGTPGDGAGEFSTLAFPNISREEKKRAVVPSACGESAGRALVPPALGLSAGLIWGSSQERRSMKDSASSVTT